MNNTMAYQENQNSNQYMQNQMNINNTNPSNCNNMNGNNMNGNNMNGNNMNGNNMNGNNMNGNNMNGNNMNGNNMNGNNMNGNGNLSAVQKLFQVQPITGPRGGTSIFDLHDKKDDVESKKSQSEDVKSHNNESESVKTNNEERKKIKVLVKDINKSLDSYSPSRSNLSDSEDESVSDDGDVKKENINLVRLKESIILICIYIFISQHFINRTIGKYISYINPREDGSVSIVGYLIYGVFISMLFMFFRKVLLNK
jgi:hypothetical protein